MNDSEDGPRQRARVRSGPVRQYGGRIAPQRRRESGAEITPRQPDIGGLVVATLLTLVFLPALYVAWFRIEPETEQTAAEPAPDLARMAA